MGRVIGIDLGTTYSCLSVFDERQGKFTVIPSRAGTATTPSVVAMGKDGQIIVGAAAKARMAADRDNTVVQIKRHMGEPQRDAAGNDVIVDGKPAPYKVRFAGKEHTPEMISAYILRDLKQLAEEFLGEPVAGAVITVPAYFKGGPRQATEDAGMLAGLEVKCLVSEPTAAAIAFGLSTPHLAADDDEADDGEAKRILVYDLGGGTFDVSVIEIRRGNIEVKGVGGDHYLGGVDFDQALTDWIVRRIKEENGVDLLNREGLPPHVALSFKQAYDRIFVEAEKTKIALSAQQSASINLPFLYMHPREQTMVNVEIEVSRNDFLTMIAAKLKGTLATVDQTLADANIKKEQIDDVLLVGGSTRIPKIRQMLEKHFGKAPRSDINPDECVALGAAMQGLRYVDTTKMTTEREQKVEAQLSQMGQVIDVTGHSLGVREGSDNMSVLIPKNSPIPATEEKLYVTASDFQTQVKVSVFQGEDSSVGKNTLLKEFEVQGLPPLPAGQVKIKIRFSLDLNGVLQVSCVDMVRNKEHTIEARYGGATTAKPSDLLSGPQPAGAPTPGAAAPAPTATLQRIPKSMHENWKRAEELLPTLPAVDREKLDRGMKEYLAALDAKDAAAIDDKGNALIDILFDVTPI